MVVRRFEHPDGMFQLLAVADLLDGAGELLLGMAPDGADVVYSDPPWNPGNEKWWRRHAGTDPPDSYDNLLDAWCGVVSALNPFHVFCEQSVNDKHRALFTSAVDRCSEWKLPLLEEWVVHYGSPGGRSCERPNKLLHFGFGPLLTDPSGMKGVPMTRRVFEGIPLSGPGWLVVDPCMGKGMTSRLAHERGWNVVGTELNSKRLDFTIRWLLKHGYTEVCNGC